MMTRDEDMTILRHELVHAHVALSLGAITVGIKITPEGGFAEPAWREEVTAREEYLCRAAAPAMGLDTSIDQSEMRALLMEIHPSEHAELARVAQALRLDALREINALSKFELEDLLFKATNGGVWMLPDRRKMQ